MNFCEISKKYFNAWVTMGMALWPNHTQKEIEREFHKLLRSKKYQTVLGLNEDDNPIAFVNLSLRSDYVDGATASPVGYIEGIYVNPKYRKQGIAKKLIKIAEQWAKKQGCNELASDVKLNNRDSQKFHKNVGFKKGNILVHFIKRIP